MNAAQEAGVEIIIKTGRTLWDADELVRRNHDKPTMSITQVQHAGESIGEVPEPIPAPLSLPDPGTTSLSFAQTAPPPTPDFQASIRERHDASYAQLAGPNGDFAVPTLQELGIPPATSPIRGGETLGLQQLQRILDDVRYTATFEKPQTAPTDFAPQSTTLLSPHMHFGSVSVRRFWHGVQDALRTYKGKPSHPPVSLTGQLMFRDMYFGAQAKLSYPFAQTLYNSHARFIPWHLPSKIDHSTRKSTGEYHIDSPQAEEWFQRWKWGVTGFPWIDALMRQLRKEGWIHHLGRHAVACFLTRGGCYISWERGADVFEEWLVDHETACNAGNWQWLSCSAFYAQYYRCYSPIAFPKKTDSDGKFVRHYCPELKDIPAKYIYEPWKAPIADLRRAGVKFVTYKGQQDGKEGEYVKPMFDFNERRNICIEGLKEAYRVGLYGDDPRAIDGTWRELFGDEGEGPTEGVKFEDAMGAAAGDGDKVKRETSMSEASKDKVTGEDGDGAADLGGDNKGGDVGGNKRKRGQSTMDAHVKKTKK